MTGASATDREDALFWIAFDNQSAEDLLPIVGLFDAQDRERQRARRIRRRNGLPIYA